MRNHASERNAFTVLRSRLRRPERSVGPLPASRAFFFRRVFPQNHGENGTPNKMRLRSIPFYRGVLTAGRISAENIKTIQTKIGDEN